MKAGIDIEAWRELVAQSLSEVGASALHFLPQLVGTLVLLGVGWALSKLVEVLVRRLLHKLGLDRLAARIQISDRLGRVGVTATPSWICARLLFWFLMLTVVLVAITTLGISPLTTTIDRLIAFLPSAITAVLLLLFGLLVGRFIQSVVSSGAAAANLAGAQRMGAAAGGLVLLLVVVLALEQLGIETTLLVTLLSVLVAASCLTIGVTFALGAKPIVTHILAGHFLRQSLPTGSTVEVQGKKGRVERVGPVDTLIRSDDRSWSIPNGALIDETIER